MQFSVETLQCALDKSKPPSLLYTLVNGELDVHLSVTDSKLSLVFEDLSVPSAENKKVLDAVNLM